MAQRYIVSGRQQTRRARTAAPCFAMMFIVDADADALPLMRRLFSLMRAAGARRLRCAAAYMMPFTLRRCHYALMLLLSR
jgi:hypothetical protein